MTEYSEAGAMRHSCAAVLIPTAIQEGLRLMLR